MNAAFATSKVRKWRNPWQYSLPCMSDRHQFRTLRWLRVSPRPSPSASLKCRSCPSWCHHSSLRRRRRTTCSGGRSLCGNPPGASVGRSPAPRRRRPSCSPSPPTSRAGGSTRHSPWWLPSVFTAVVTQAFIECVFFLCSWKKEWGPVSSDEDAQHALVQQATKNLKVSWSVFGLASKSFRALRINIYRSSAPTILLLRFCNRSLLWMSSP